MHKNVDLYLYSAIWYIGMSKRQKHIIPIDFSVYNRHTSKIIINVCNVKFEIVKEFKSIFRLFPKKFFFVESKLHWLILVHYLMTSENIH